MRGFFLWVLPQFPALGAAILGDEFDSLLPQSFVSWKSANLLPFVIIMILLWGFCNATAAWLRKRSELSAISGALPDLPMSNAITYILTKKRHWKKSSDVEVCRQICELAAQSKVSVWGMVGQEYGSNTFWELVKSDVLTPIEEGFFDSAVGAATPDMGFYLKKLHSFEGLRNRATPDHYYEVTVNRSQIRHFFSRCKPLKR